ncbi:hypothetical protein BOX15_Mlig026769g4 [Macrostomum lignano]|uniref:Uncharacterized protein n=1 Tax=Macrostomum lignano TaxID=282301 RepID=A0A267EGQ7_9PLAT|nr:hypothetical protein BOX15_Mlig026769g4 [Macrostomum lignano]
MEDKERLQAALDELSRDHDTEAQSVEGKVSSMKADLHQLALEYRQTCTSFRNSVRIISSVDKMLEDANKIHARARTELAKMAEFCSDSPATIVDSSMATEVESLGITLAVNTRASDSTSGSTTIKKPVSLIQKVALIDAFPTVKVTDDSMRVLKQPSRDTTMPRKLLNESAYLASLTPQYCGLSSLRSSFRRVSGKDER